MSKVEKANPFIAGYVEGVMGPERNNDPEVLSFTEREESEQLNLMYEFFDIMAEKRLYSRENSQNKEKEPKNTRVVKLPGGRRLVVPVSVSESENKNPDLSDKQQEKLAEIDARLEKFRAMPGFREAYTEKLHRTIYDIKAVKTKEQLEDELTALHKEHENILAESGMQVGNEPSGIERIRLEEVLERIEKIKERLDRYSSFYEGQKLDRFMEIKQYAEAYSADQLMLTPSTRETLEWGMDHLRKRQHIVLAGHLGSGKTALAKELAKSVMLEQGMGGEEALHDPQGAYDNMDVEIFSGSYEASIYDLIGKLKLKLRADTSVNEEIEKNDEKIKAYEQKYDVKIDREKLLLAYTGKSEVVETIPEYGPLVRALRDGKPCIIDEFNRMRPEVLARLNDIALAPVGSHVRIQENGAETFEIKQGFVLIFTCNLGEKYQNLEQVDAAFGSRLNSREVDYPLVDETYDMIISALINKDRLRFPRDFPSEQFPQLTDLAICTREVQDIFSGNTEGQSFAGIAAGQGVNAAPAALKGSVLSPRDLMRKIIGTWRANNFRRTLDEVVAEEFIRQQIYEPGDRQFLTEIFLRRGFFKDWDMDKFRRHGLIDLGEQEIKALRSEAIMEMFRKQDYMADSWNEAHDRVTYLQRDLLIGSKKAAT